MSADATSSDPILDRLNALYGKQRGIRFSAASDPVVRGVELEDTGNRRFGPNIYVATGRRFEAHPRDLLIGRQIAPGAVERYPKAELRCFVRGERVVVAVYDPDGRRASRELSCPLGTVAAYDEGLFTWFGPKETICTPWSDNDPDDCQVITIHRLRRFAREMPAERD